MAELLVAILAFGAAVFTSSAFGKLRSRAAYRDYRAGLRTAGLLPRSLGNMTPLALVAAEVTAASGLTGAVALLVTRSAGGYSAAEAALAAAIALAAALTAGVAITVRRRIPVTCRCFGGGAARPLGIAHLMRNAFLLIVFAVGQTAAVVASSHDSRLVPGVSALAVLAGLLVMLLVVRWDDLASLLAAPAAARDRAPR